MQKPGWDARGRRRHRHGDTLAVNRSAGDSCYAGPIHVAREGVIYLVHLPFHEDDGRRLTPTATCVPFDEPAVAQSSAEDLASMLNGYFRALFLLNDIRQQGLTPELGARIEAILSDDEKHVLGQCAE